MFYGFGQPSKKISFVTKDGKRVSFTPKKKRSGPTPPHLKTHTTKMKKLGAAYRSGDLGRISWKGAVKKYMVAGGPPIPGGRKSSTRRRVSSKRKGSKRKGSKRKSSRRRR
jgi:hypothetical protein